METAWTIFSLYVIIFGSLIAGGLYAERSSNNERQALIRNKKNKLKAFIFCQFNQPPIIIKGKIIKMIFFSIGHIYNTFIIFKYSGHSPISFHECSLTGKQPTRPPLDCTFSIK